MSKAISWTNQLAGRNYSFSYQRVKGKHTLIVDGETTIIKPGFLSSTIGLDEEFLLNGNPARLLIEKNYPQIVVDNVYLESGKPYKQRPAWVLVFAFLCLLIPIVSFGGAMPILLGIFGSTSCIGVSKTSMNTPIKFFLCIVITFLTWVLWVVLLLAVGMIIPT